MCCVNNKKESTLLIIKSTPTPTHHLFQFPPLLFHCCVFACQVSSQDFRDFLRYRSDLLRSVGWGTFAYQDSNWESMDSESRVTTVRPCTQLKPEIQTLAFVAENFQCKSVLALGCSVFLFCCFAVLLSAGRKG